MPQSIQQVICDSIADGVFTVDKDWRITSFNQAAEEITGISRDQAIGQRCFEVLHADICEQECALKRSMDTGEKIIARHVNILNSDGETVPVSISTSVLRDDDGNVIGGVETVRDLSALELLRKEIDQRYTCHDIISKNHRIQEIFNILPDVAVSDSTVLIEGPTGSGKELFAKALHNLSDRADGPFVAVNCGALPDTLLESELFGYKKGAFTDARKDKPGRFALAQGGTLFLDEIGDISTALQVKLLRVLQEKTYEPLGGTEPVKADVRIITATNQNLTELMSRGVFRDDLYYRLRVLKITLPPLRDRREDIPLLVQHFIHKFNTEKGKEIRGVSEQAMAALMRYEYPGNIRELENFIEHAFVLCREDRIRREHLPDELLDAVPAPEPDLHLEMGDYNLERLERLAIDRALEKHNGNRTRAAEELGINPSTLWRKIQKAES